MKNKAFKLALTIVIAGALVFGASFAKATTNEDMIKMLQSLIQILRQMVQQLQQQLAQKTTPTSPIINATPSIELKASLSGPTYLVLGETVTYTANVSGGTPPYTFEWSSDGLISQNGSTAVYGNFIPFITHKIILTVIDSKGISTNAIVQVSVLEIPPEQSSTSSILNKLAASLISLSKNLTAALTQPAEDLPTGTLSITPSEVNLGESFKITVTGQDDQGMKSVGLSYQGNWHAESCNNQTTCTKTFIVTETKAGTYVYGTYLEGTTTSGGSEWATTNPQTVTGTVKSITPTLISVTVSRPTQGETITGNSPYTIQWTHTDSDSKFNHYWIGYQCDGDSNTITIGNKNSINDATLSWTVPNVNTDKTNCQVGVYAMDVNGSMLSTGRSDNFTIKASAQPQCVDVISNGSPTDKLDIVFVGSDYSENEKTKFISDVNAHMQQILSVYPFSTYKNRINIHRIDAFRDLGCKRLESIPRLIICDPNQVKNLADSCPHDQIIVLENSNDWGGCGGNIYDKDTWDTNICVAASAYPWITLHEFSHSFGKLWDEYSFGYDGPVEAIDSSPNCASDSNCYKWNNIVGAGCFQGCSFSNAYRSIIQGIMSTAYATNYGPVSEKHLIELLNNYR